MVDGEFGSETPSPVHPLKEYPEFGMAEIDGLLPYSNCPEPVTEPPSVAWRFRVWVLISKRADTFRSSVISTVVDRVVGLWTPSPVHRTKEYP